MDFDYEMDFILDPDVYELEAEPVYLTAKSYSTETLTKNAAMDLSPSESTGVLELFNERLQHEGPLLAINESLESSSSIEDEPNVLHDINYKVDTASSDNEAVVSVPLSVSSDSDKENLMKISDSALKKFKHGITGITALENLNSKIDVTKNTSGYGTMDDSVLSLSSSFSEIENSAECNGVAIQDLVKPSIFSPVNSPTNGIIQTVAVVQIEYDAVPGTSTGARQNDSTEESSRLDQTNLLHNLNYSGRSSSSLPPIIDPSLQTPSTSNAEVHPIVETPKLKRKLREQVLTARFDSSASTHFGDDENDSIDTETSSFTTDSCEENNAIQKLPRRGRGRPPKRNLNNKRKIDESPGPTRSSKRIKTRQESQPTVEEPIPKEPIPIRPISKKKRYFCPQCNCELATRTIFNYHVGKCN